MSDNASLTDLENELWGDPQTSADLMALGVSMEELTANDAWGQYMLSPQNQVSATVSPPRLPPTVPHDPIMDIFSALDAIDASIAQMDTGDACPSQEEDVVWTLTTRPPIRQAGDLQPPGSGGVILQTSNTEDGSSLHPLPSHGKDSVATPTSTAPNQPAGALSPPRFFPQAGGVGVKQTGFTAPLQGMDMVVAGPSSAPQTGISGPVNQVGGALNQGLPLRIVEERIKQLRRFFYTGREVTVHLGAPASDRDALSWLEEQITNLLNRLQDHGVSADDHVGLLLNSTDSTLNPVYVSFRRADQLDARAVLENVSRVLQSNNLFLSTAPMYVKLSHFKEPRGRGNHKCDKISPASTYSRNSRGIITIQNDDTICLARALVVAKAICDNKREPECMDVNTAKQIKMGRPIQKLKAEELCHNARVNLLKGGGITELKQFQTYLSGYKITVFRERRGRHILYEGPAPAEHSFKGNLDLYFHDDKQNHFDVITSLTAAFKCSYFCRECRVPFNDKNKHKCESSCKKCYAKAVCSGGQSVVCKDCGRWFTNQTCFDNHKRPGFCRGHRSVCDVKKVCEVCGQFFSLERSNYSHRCYETFCRVCDSYRPFGHFCYMKQAPSKPLLEKSNFMFVFYDFECRQETLLQGAVNTYLHEPNLCVVQTCCKACLHIDANDNHCTDCGGDRTRIFGGDTTMAQFFGFIEQIKASKFKDITLLGHNSKGYDGNFILKYMMEVKKWTPDLIMNGGKIMSMRYGPLHFIDSLNFLPMSLSKMPKTFDLDESLAKGHFPHFFNKKENAGYRGPLPPKEDYGIGEMSVEGKEHFEKWYDALVKENYVFDFNRELELYCVKDVEILRKACLKFRDMLIEKAKVDPFREACTIAGAAMLVYRRSHLKENTIGIIPNGGYRCADQQSHIAVQWLCWEAHQRGVSILHAGNGREEYVLGRRVDGVVKAGDTTTVFQIWGCYWHGCPLCYPGRTTPIKNSPHETMETRYEATMACVEKFKNAGYTVVEMWECTFNAMKRTDKDLKQFVLRHEVYSKEPLSPRDAFFGGRTNCIKLFHEADLSCGEKIKYLDVCSLYPYVCKYKKYPIGHPKIHLEPNCPAIDKVEGIAKVTVTPPRDLFMPVLPTRMHDKLMFILCRKCGEEKNQGACQHNDKKDRWLTGVWVIDEIRKAVEKGYTVEAVHEVWEYNVSVYDRQTRSGGLFHGYIDTFLKIKQEASGWPEWCTSQDEKLAYIQNYEEREGVKLDFGSVCKNPGLRTLAKLFLNSLWGKFGQRPDLPHVAVVNDYQGIHKYLTDPYITVDSVIDVNDEVMFLNYKDARDALRPNPNTSVAVACYTTAMARLHLYSILEKLGDRVLYHDTDSVLFTERPGDWSPPTGDFLGDLTDELQDYGPGSYISAFVSGGPKNYAYRVCVGGDPAKTKTVCKVRGITINYGNRNDVNFDVLKAMVTEQAAERYIQIPHKIVRKGLATVCTVSQNKVYRPVYTKRRITDDYNTLPFGYQSPCKRLRHN